MAPSNANSRRGVVAWLDWAAFWGIVAGLVAYVIPYWPEGRLRVAFWLTLVSTLLHVYTSHQRRPAEPGELDA